MKNIITITLLFLGCFLLAQPRPTKSDPEFTPVKPSGEGDDIDLGNIGRDPFAPPPLPVNVGTITPKPKGHNERPGQAERPEKKPTVIPNEKAEPNERSEKESTSIPSNKPEPNKKPVPEKVLTNEEFKNFREKDPPPKEINKNELEHNPPVLWNEYWNEPKSIKTKKRIQYSYSNGDYYDGPIVDNTPHRYGKYVYANGDVFLGHIEKGNLAKGLLKKRVHISKDVYAIQEFDGIFSNDDFSLFKSGDFKETHYRKRLNGENIKVKEIEVSGDVFKEHSMEGVPSRLVVNGTLYKGKLINSKLHGIVTTHNPRAGIRSKPLGIYEYVNGEAVNFIFTEKTNVLFGEIDEILKKAGHIKSILEVLSFIKKFKDRTLVIHIVPGGTVYSAPIRLYMKYIQLLPVDEALESVDRITYNKIKLAIITKFPKLNYPTVYETALWRNYLKSIKPQRTHRAKRY